MNRFRVLLLLCLILLTGSVAYAATVHAFLDRDHAVLGDTVTLNIEGPDVSASTPDLSPLQKDFDVLGTSSSSSVQIVNGTTRSTAQLGIALRPKRAGTITIPPLNIGNAQTQALILQVSPAPSGARGGDDAFIEASVASSAPYVGQQDVYTLRLFYAGGLTGGQLDDPQADGAQLIHLSGDARYQTQRGGKNYQVVERHYALIPQHSGHIVVRGPTFLGQMLMPDNNSGNANDLFNQMFDDGKPVQARADDIALDARAIPAGAGTPWLPAQSVQLDLRGLPADGRIRVGEPLSLTLSVAAIGQSAERLPEPQLPPIDGARVYPDKTQDSTRDDGHWLHGTRTRSFAIVPNRDGTLTIPAITLNWWDVAHDRAQQARLPAHTLQVAGAVAGGNAPASAAFASASTPARAVLGDAVSRVTNGMIWRDLAIASVALWILALTAFAWWVFARRRKPVVASADADSLTPSHESTRGLRQRMLDAARACNAAVCERSLLDWARMERPRVHHAGDLRAALSDPVQRAALEQLERARWKGGDPREACNKVADVFARGFAWNDAGIASNRVSGDGLPPLYPS